MSTDSLRTRAFLIGIAGDANATTVTAQQLLARADGLAGRPVDGKVDAVEAESLLTIADQSNLSASAVADLRRALTTRSSLDIPSAQRTSGALRFPANLDLASLSTSRRCGGTPEVGTLVDRNGYQVALTNGRDGVIVRFAPAGADVSAAAPMYLTASETAVLAPHLAALQLREARTAPTQDAAYDAVCSLDDTGEPMSTTPTRGTDYAAVTSNHQPAAAADERDLSVLRTTLQTSRDDATGNVTERFNMGDGYAFIRYNAENPGQVGIAFSNDSFGFPSEYRPMTARELSTFMASRELAPLWKDLWLRNFVAVQGFRQLTAE